MILGWSWGGLGKSREVLGRSWEALGRSWEVLGWSWGGPGVVLGWSWTTPRTTRNWANYKDDTYVGTSDGSCQLPGPCTGTSLRPVKGIILGYILGLKPLQDMGN